MRRAVRQGDAARVHQLLTAAGLPRLERPLPPTLAPLIFEACCSGDIDCVEMLLDREAGEACAAQPAHVGLVIPAWLQDEQHLGTTFNHVLLLLGVQRWPTLPTCVGPHLSTWQRCVATQGSALRCSRMAQASG